MPVDMHMPQPMPDDPFMDDKKPLDPNTPPPSRETYYKPYFKKNNATTKAASPTPAKTVVPAAHDPYAVAPPVHIQARPVQAAVKVAQAEAFEYTAVKVAAHNAEAVTLTISDDEPPAPPSLLPVRAASRYEGPLPTNPLRR